MKFGPAVVLTMWILLSPGAGAAVAAPSGPGPLLTAADLPGFTALPAATLPAGEAFLDQMACLTAGQTSRVGITRSGWSDGQSSLVELLAVAPSDEAAAALQGDIVRCVSPQPHFAVPGVTGAATWTWQTAAAGQTRYARATAVRRGLRVAALEQASVQPVGSGLISHLTSVEVARMPSGATQADDVDNAHRSGNIAGTLLAVLVIYPELMDMLAVRRNRRAWRAVPGQPAAAAQPGQVTDVTAAATRMHLRALVVFLLEIGALAAAGFGTLFVATGRGAGWPLLATAALLVVSLYWFRRRTVRIGGLPRMRGGSYVLRALSLILGVVGFAVLLAGAWVQSLGGQAELDSGPSTGAATVLLSLPILALAVILHRLAVRLTLSHPPRDGGDGAPILYLRSFGDDRLKLRVAPYARRSFLERLSSRRRQSFEETIAEDLQRRAPVAAVGEPGQRLPPIGFVRRSMSGDEWQPHVWQWIDVADTIVVVVGPGDGLRWEIEALTRSGAWRKTIFVFPPVDGQELRRRRHRLADLLARNGFRGPAVADPWTPAMTVALDGYGVCHYWCGHRINAWSYKAALDDTFRFHRHVRTGPRPVPVATAE